MSALTPLFIWLLPLAFLPVIIHLLNRLRYRTVKWAAMMFLRTADRDASRRAKIRQWIILAARCLMLAMFLLALARLQSKGKLARFFDKGSNLVVVIFDRSASMEQLRGGSSGRERGLALVQQGLVEMGSGTRVLWIDGATGSVMPLPGGVELSRLPFSTLSSAPVDISLLMRTALQEVARAGVVRAEIWIPSDRQASAWMPEGAAAPDWSEWSGMNTQVAVRLLDVALVSPDAGNRAIQLTGEPQRDGNQLMIPLRLIRDRADAEAVALTIESQGLSLQEEILVEGTTFRWDQPMEILPGQDEFSVRLKLPADSNNADNDVAVAWRTRGAVRAKIDLSSPGLTRAVRAGLLPRPLLRELTDRWAKLDESVALWVREAGIALTAEEQAWVDAGGVLLQLPGEDTLTSAGEEPLSVREWNEQNGPLASEQGEALRLDLLRVNRFTVLAPAEGTEVMARLEDGSALLTRRVSGEGAIYSLATLPIPDVSNLDAGYIWVPILQRLLQEGRRTETRWGNQRLGDWKPGEGEEWVSAESEELDPRLNSGLFSFDNRLVALNRSLAEDNPQALSIDELKAWAAPLDFRVFEDRSERGGAEPRRVELTSILSLLGLLFLAIESFLLTRNVRRPSAPRSAWSATA